jgi:hypothetical protein
LFNQKFKRQKRQFEEKFIIGEEGKNKEKKTTSNTHGKKIIFGYFLIAN